MGILRPWTPPSSRGMASHSLQASMGSQEMAMMSVNSSCSCGSRSSYPVSSVGQTVPFGFTKKTITSHLPSQFVKLPLNSSWVAEIACRLKCGALMRGLIININFIFMIKLCRINSLQRYKRNFSILKNANKFLKENMETYSKLMPIIQPEDKNVRKAVIFTVSATIVSKLLTATSPLFLKQAVNFITLNNLQQSLLCIMAQGLVRSLFLGIDQQRNQVFHKDVLSIQVKMLNEMLFKKIQSLEQKQLQNNQKSIINTANRGIDGAQNILRSNITFLIPAVLELAFSIGMINQTVGHEVAVTFVSTMGLYSLQTVRSTIKRIDYFKRNNDAEDAKFKTFLESLDNFDIIKQFNLENKELKRYDNRLDDKRLAELDVQQSLNTLNFGQHFIFTSGVTLSLSIVCWKISMGILSPGDLILISALVAQIGGPLFFMGTIQRQLKENQVKMNDMFNMLESKDNLASCQEQAHLPLVDIANFSPTYSKSKEQSIIIENLSMKQDDNMLFENLSMEIEKNQSVGLVGTSGSGKSTLFNLIFRLQEPQSGNIYINGYNIKNLNTNQLRSQLSIVPQNINLFNESILHNLTLNQDEPVEESSISKVNEQLSKIGLDKRILSLGESVGANGGNFSGGERQRIAFVRTLLRSPNILMLDEVTSSLDVETEFKLLTLVNQIRKISPMTVVWTAHRLSTLLKSDKIFVLDKGSLVESGTHQQLIDSQGLQLQLWNKFLQNDDKEKECGTGNVGKKKEKEEIQITGGSCKCK